MKKRGTPKVQVRMGHKIIKVGDATGTAGGRRLLVRRLLLRTGDFSLVGNVSI